MPPLPLVAIVGRPNVGKSTLFNRLVRRRAAIVQDTPGVTRDRNYGEACWESRRFVAIDTGGFDPTAEAEVEAGVRQQAAAAVEEADLVLLLLDGRAGLLPADEEVAAVLRASGRPTLAVVNKVDGPGQDGLVHDFHRLGFDPLLPVSAEHARGMRGLVEAILAALGEAAPLEGEEADDEIRVAVVGRPNAGKSTLVNRLCGEERVLVASEPGTTRDAIDTLLEAGGRRYRLIDTAGIRRRPKVTGAVEHYAVVKAFSAVERAHVVLLLVDAGDGLADQDLRLAELVAERGRSLAILLNKWDSVSESPDRHPSREEVLADVARRTAFVAWAPVLTVSGKTGQRCRRLLPLVDRLRAAQVERIQTGVLNRDLQRWYEAHRPAVFRGKNLRFYYAAQVGVLPPTFVFSVSAAAGVRSAYRRYLINRLRDEYGFPGAPIQLRFKTHHEPGERRQGKASGARRGRRPKSR